MTITNSKNSNKFEFEDSLKQEENRLKTLFEYCPDLETSEDELDEITKLLSINCKTPIACVTLLDSDKVWFKSKTGLECVNSQSAVSFCKHAMEQNEIFEVFDSQADSRFKAHPQVTDFPFIRYYAGVPLVTPSGYNIGVLCVIDCVPRTLKQSQKVALVTLAKHVMMFFELKKRNKELKMSTEKSNKLAKAKDEFLSNMSHEIRTPLNAIYGFTELLSKTNLNKNQKEMLNIVKSSVEILMAIINDILDFSKIESGNLQIKNHPFDLERAIINIKELFSHKAGEKNLALNFYIDKKLPKIINADKIRISQVITNLIGNAIKFTNKGSIELTVKQTEETEDQITIDFSVKDTGIGIQKEKLETIFERFQQADYEITRKYGGTGLGLSISKSLVEMQGGKLSIESEHGKGSVFSFALCVAKVNELKTQKFLNIDKKGKRYKIEEEKKRFNEELKKILKKDKIDVLILEDTIFNYILIEKIFENTIINLDYAENGKIGLQKFEKKVYDMVLLDLQMPVMDGFEFATNIRSIKRSDILMLAMTANNLNFDKQKCFKIGINDYFTKPFKRKSLLDGIIRNFSNKANNTINNFNYSDNFDNINNISNLSIVSLQGSCNSNSNTIINNDLSNNCNNNFNFNFNNNENFENCLINLNFDDYVLKNDFNFTISSNSISNNSKLTYLNQGLNESKEKLKIKRSKKKRRTVKSSKASAFKKSDEEDQQNLFSTNNFPSNNENLNKNFEKKNNLLSDFTESSNKENFCDESLKESDQSHEDLEMLRIIRKGNFIKFFINEEEYQSDLNVIEKNNNFKNSNLKISSSFLDTETEPEIIIDSQIDLTNNNFNNDNTSKINNICAPENTNSSKIVNFKQKIESNVSSSNNNYNMSGFSTQDEISKEKKNNFFECSIKDSFNNNLSKKCSLFQSQSLKTKEKENYKFNDLIEAKDLFDFSEQEKIEFEKINFNLNNKTTFNNIDFNNRNSIHNLTNKLKSEKICISSNLTEKDSICLSEENSSFDLNFLARTNLEKSENNLTAKSRFKKLKSKFSIGEYEKDYYSTNHSVNSIIKDLREVKSECFTYKKRNFYCSKKLNKSKFKKRNYKNDETQLLDNEDSRDSCESRIISSNSCKAFNLKKKGFSSSDEQELFNFNYSNSNSKSSKNFYCSHNNSSSDNPEVKSVKEKEKRIHCSVKNALNAKNNFDNDYQKDKDLVNVDFSYLEEISGGDYDFQNELALIFLSETPIQIAKLKIACEKFEFKDIHLITHSLKTSFNILGVVNIKEKFMATENLVKKIKDADLIEDGINNNYNISNKKEIEEIKIKIANFSDWLNDDYPDVFKTIEEKIFTKFAKK